VLENGTLIQNAANNGAGFQADDEPEWMACSEIAEGECKFTLTNTLILDSARAGISVDQSAVTNWLVEYSNVHGSAYANYPGSESISDSSGYIRNSRNQAVSPTMGTGRVSVCYGCLIIPTCVEKERTVETSGQRFSMRTKRQWAARSRAHHQAPLAQ